MIETADSYAVTSHRRVADAWDSGRFDHEVVLVADSQDMVSHRPSRDRVLRRGGQSAAVLLRTGWDRHWGTDRYGDPVHLRLTEAGARTLVGRGAALVGIDSVNIDEATTGQRPAHTVLLAAGIPIVELPTGLDGVPATGAIFTAVPSAMRGLATFPVCAFASVP